MFPSEKLQGLFSCSSNYTFFYEQNQMDQQYEHTDRFLLFRWNLFIFSLYSI